MMPWAAFFMLVAIFAILGAGACRRFDRTEADRQRDMDLRRAEGK